MTRVQPVLSETETALVDRVAQVTRTSRADVIRNALNVYHWFVKQTITGARVLARNAAGDEVALETLELAALEGEAHKLSPAELGALARRLAATRDPAETSRLRERLARGFYGI